MDIDGKLKVERCRFDIINATVAKCSPAVRHKKMRLSISELLFERENSLDIGSTIASNNRMKVCPKIKYKALILLGVLLLVLALITMITLFCIQFSKCNTDNQITKQNEENTPPGKMTMINNCLRAPALQLYSSGLKKSFEEFQNQLKQKCLDDVKRNKLQKFSLNVFYDGNELLHVSSDKVNKFNEENLYPIASITKVITAMLLYKLEQTNRIKINIDDDIRNEKYFPNLEIKNNFNKAKVTLRDMTCQMSGLTREAPCYSQSNGNYCPFNTSIMLKRLDKTRLITPPAQFPSYSNLAFALLGRGLEKSFNESYEEMVKRHILVPLGMENTKFQTASSNDKIDPGSANIPNVTDWGWLRPAAGLFATTNDLGRLSNAFFGNGSFLRHSTAQKMLGAVFDFPDGSSQGCPFEIRNYQRNFKKSYRLYMKQGSTDGYQSLFVLLPTLKLNINVLTKGFEESSLAILGFTLPTVIDIFEKWMVDENKIKYKLPSNPNQFTGSYQLISHWPLITKPANITLASNQLFLELEWLKVPLTFINKAILRTGDFNYASSHYNCDVLASGLIGMDLKFHNVRLQTKAISFTIDNVAAYGLLQFERII